LDPVEQEGVRRAQERAAGADLVLWVIDAAAGGAIPADRVGEEFSSNNKWLICNKSDLISPSANQELRSIIHAKDYRYYFISTLTELGFGEFLSALAAHARHYLGSSEPALVTRDRHRRALADTVAALGRAAAEPSPAREDIVAEELRLAARALGRLTGRVDIEDILDVIFRDFCIGK
jgi:tRNA modification GTPase